MQDRIARHMLSCYVNIVIPPITSQHT